MKTLRLSFATAAMILFSSPAWAVLLGSSVSGTLNFNAGSTNFFDPNQGFVPAGSLNLSGVTVLISASATEFGFNDGLNNDLADFTATQLIITNAVLTNQGSGSWKMTFSNPAFAGISLVNSNFSGLTASFANNTITLDWLGYSVNQSLTSANDAPNIITFTATYNVSTTGGAATPDGGATALLLGLVLVAIALIARHIQPKLAHVRIRR